MSWNTSIVDGPIPIEGVSGYHLNLAPAAVPAEAVAYLVTPEPFTPARTFAGDVQAQDGTWPATAFLRFPDEATARAVLAGLWMEPETVGSEA